MLQEAVVIIGVLTSGGVECQAFKAQDGKLYSLVGNVPTREDGQKFQISGTILNRSYCMQGITIRVESFEKQ
jgi:hypothetical protein